MPLQQRKEVQTVLRMMMKVFVLFLALGFFGAGSHAAELAVTIEICAVKVSSGRVYISVYDSEAGYKNDLPRKSTILDSTLATLTIRESLPEGDYLVKAFQDVNNNGRLDTNFIGIPREPVGLSNYSGKGRPGGFMKLKIRVDKESQVLQVRLIQL